MYKGETGLEEESVKGRNELTFKKRKKMQEHFRKRKGK